ncbi:MAG: hypothetical protein JWM19_7148 [Actinomycetia bacterium]|nr:hypothetical protein [Actinomycetes bacterium]
MTPVNLAAVGVPRGAIRPPRTSGDAPARVGRSDAAAAAAIRCGVQNASADRCAAALTTYVAACPAGSRECAVGLDRRPADGLAEAGSHVAKPTHAEMAAPVSRPVITRTASLTHIARSSGAFFRHPAPGSNAIKYYFPFRTAPQTAA